MRGFIKKSIYTFTVVVIIAVLIFARNDISYVNAYSYNSNVLTNPTPSSTSGWELTKAGWNNGDYGGEFKGTSNDPMYAKQTFTFSERDRYRINNGEIKIDASGYFWAQASSYMYAYLKTTFYNASGTNLGNKTVSYDKYSVTKHNEQLSFSDYTVPAGTAYLVFEAKNDDSLAGIHPSMRQFVLKVKDSTKPTYIVTAPVTTPNKYKVGTKIRYQVTFSEPVNVTSAGYIKFKVGTQEFNTNSTFAGQNSDGTILYYDFTLPNTSTLGDNLAVTVTGLSGITVADDAGNSTSVNQSLSLSNGFYVDNKPPEVTNFTTTASTNAVYKAGETLQFDVTFHENIWVSGTPKINLSNGKSATYVKQTTSDTKIASFFYTIADGDDKKNIAITSIDFTGIRDSVSNDATSSPSYSTSAYNSFMNDKYVSIDTVAPVAEFPEAPEGWQKAYDIILSSTDNISGVKEIYSVWTAVNGTPSFPAVSNVDTDTNKVPLPANSGIYELHIKLKDNVDNEVVQKSPYIYYFDLDAPAITVNADKISGTDIVMSVTAAAEDSHSGLNTFTYEWKNDDIIILSGDVSQGVSIPSEDGIYTLTVTASDKAGNTSSKTIGNLAVDTVAPQVVFEQTSGTSYQKRYTVDFNVTDLKAGVDKYYYIWNASAEKPAIDSEEWLVTSASSLSTPAGVSGTYYLHIKAVDKVGNVGIVSTDGFNIDNIPPSVSVSPNGNMNNIGMFDYDVNIYINDETTAYDQITKRYAISDKESCPEDLLALTDNHIIIENLNVTKYLYIVATDLAGNETVFKSNPFIADTKAPAGSISKPADIYYINNNNVTININAEDDYSPTVYMQIKVDDSEGPWEELIEQKTIAFEPTEGEHTIYARFKDVRGNTSEYVSVKYYYDVTPPEICLDYSQTGLTNSTVTVIATAYDSVSDVLFETVSEYIFNENGSFEFVVVDEAGNRTRALATVDYIDKIKPQITFTSNEFDGKKHKFAEVIINAADISGIKELKYAIARIGQTPDDYKNCSNGESILIEGLEDGTYTVFAIAVDNAGNSATSTSQNIYIDNTPPVAEITYFPATRTAQNVIATIGFNEEAVVTNNNGSNEYIFTENGEFIFEFSDTAGNTGTKTAKVDWIDRNQPVASVFLSNEDWTSEDVTVTITPQEGAVIQNVRFNNEEIAETAENQYIVTAYGTLTYEVVDLTTNIVGTGQVLIRIDRTAPVVTNVTYSTRYWTNGDVTVNITAMDDLSTVVYKNGSSYTFTENGSYVFIVEDSAGNKTTEIVTVDWIDKKAPEAEIKYYVDGKEYNPLLPTNKNVTAKVFFEEEGSPVTVTNNSGSTEFEFASNGSFSFMFRDEAGNEGSITATVTKIDKVPPTGYIVYSHTGWANKDVTATLVASDDMNDIIITNNPSNEYVFTENGTFTFQFMDSAGNTATADAVVTRIDKKAPVLSYYLSTEEITPFSVYAFVTADEEITIINNNGNASRQFNSNGEFTFIAKDRAGNESQITATVNNISKETTPVVLKYSTKDLTNGDVFVTIEPKDGSSYIYVTNNDGQKTRKFTENGEFVFKYKNIAGIEGEAVASVSNIDKTPPVVEVTYSHSQVTKDNVVATFSANEEVIYPYFVVDGKYTFEKNMKLQIPVTDKAGNTTNVIIETNLIDKKSPEIIMEKQYEIVEKDGNFDEMAGITVIDDTMLDGDVEITGDYDLNTPGDYVITYTATDKAGNVTVAYKYLTVYDPDKFNVTVNGRMPTGGKIIVDSREIIIETINSGGNVTVKRLVNKKNIGDFKTKGDVIDLVSTFPGEGYFTLYITDEERNCCIVYVFITE